MPQPGSREALHPYGMNRLFVRDLVAVVLAIAAITTVALWVSRRPALPNGVKPIAVAQPHTPEALGARLYDAKGCVACHTVDGTPRVGPTFLHDYGSTVALAAGGTVAMDDAYIRESLIAPRAKARPGFSDAMPSYAGLLRDDEVAELTAYLRSLR